MFGSSIKKTFFAGALVAGMTLTGCFFDQAPSHDGQKSVVGVHVAVPQMYSLAKASTITLSKLYITLTSDVGDTIRDTITPSTIPALSASTASNQTVAKFYSVKPLRKWKLAASTIDGNSVVIHDSATGLSPTLLIGDTANLSLSMNAKFEMYRANFNNLPDSVSSATSGTVKQKINFHRLVMTIDGSNVRDSSQTFFTGSPLLDYDYVAVGSHQVVLSAYGYLSPVLGPDVLLYNDTTTINVGPGLDTTVTRPMVYRGPGSNGTGGTGNVSVTIGKVGTITINASENGTIPGL